MGSKPLVLEWKSPPSGKPGGPVLVARLGRLKIELRDAGCEATARVVFGARPTRQDAMETAEATLPGILREALAAWERARAKGDAKAKRAMLVATQYTPEQVAALRVGDSVGIYNDAELYHVARVRRRYPSGKLLISYNGHRRIVVYDDGRAVWPRGSCQGDPRYIGPPKLPMSGTT